MEANDLRTKDDLVIIGAGGHGKVCAEVAALNGYHHIIFLDDDPRKSAAVSGKTDDYKAYLSTHMFFVALGNNALRQKYTEQILSEGGEVATLIHPYSAVSADAVIRTGAVVMAGAVINAGAVIGKGAIMNTCSSVDHDNVLSDYAHIGVGAHLAGTVHIGRRTFVGAGTTIINNVTVCDDCIVGAGATVIKDITQAGTYVGVPAKKIK